MGKPKTPLSFEAVRSIGYRVKSMIGQGGFGSVYIAVHEPTLGFRVVKAIFKGDVDRAEIDNEISMMRRTDHAPNVAKLLDVVEDHYFIFICLEACMGGHLLKRLGEHRQFTERHAAVAIGDVLTALKVLHGMGIAHRDIKPQNLIYFDERADAPLKLIDFGMAVDLRRAPNGKVSEFAGTIRFMSPSVVKSQPYGSECDLWALGVTAFLLLTGTYPFNGSTVEEVAAIILAGDLRMDDRSWECVSADGRDFIRSMLRNPALHSERAPQQPYEPFDVFDALSHPWIRNRGAESGHKLDAGVRQRLLSAHNRNLLDAAVGNLVAARLQPDDIDVLMRQFELLDTNGDGHVTLDEYLQGVASLEVTYDDLRKQFATYDINKDGRISKEEFLSACVSQNACKAQAESFDTLAANRPARDGGPANAPLRRQITPTSLAAALKRMGSKESVEELAKGALQAIAEADLDDDGELSFEEFRAWVEKGDSAADAPSVSAPSVQGNDGSGGEQRAGGTRATIARLDPSLPRAGFAAWMVRSASKGSTAFFSFGAAPAPNPAKAAECRWRASAVVLLLLPVLLALLALVVDLPGGFRLS
jgi:calcium-dependent protein kinase